MTTKKTESPKEEAKKNQEPTVDRGTETSKPEFKSVDAQPNEVDPTKENKEKLEEHEQFSKDVIEGKEKIPVEKPTDLAEITAPMVIDENGKPKYETASRWIKAESAKGNL